MKKWIMFSSITLTILLLSAGLIHSLALTKVGDLQVTGDASGITAAMIDSPAADCAAGNALYGFNANLGTAKCASFWDALGDMALAEDNVYVGNGVPVASALADCDDAGGNHLNYDTGTNTFSCGTSSSVTDTKLTQEEVEDYCGGMATTGDGVDFTYVDAAGTLTPSFDCSDVAGNGLSCSGEDLILSDIVYDTTPQLGADLDCNAHDLGSAADECHGAYFGDDSYITFGTDSDSTIHHDGTYLVLTG